MPLIYLLFLTQDRSKIKHNTKYSIVGFDVPPDTLYRSFCGWFYDSTNSITALKDNFWSTRSRANPTKLSSLKGKEKDVTKNFYYIYSNKKTEDTEALRR